MFPAPNEAHMRTGDRREQSSAVLRRRRRDRPGGDDDCQDHLHAKALSLLWCSCCRPCCVVPATIGTDVFCEAGEAGRRRKTAPAPRRQPLHDSRAMAAHTKVAVGYNIQVAVDVKNKMIVAQEVTNQVVDLALLTQTAEPARAVLEVATINVVADRGYFKKRGPSKACEKAGMTPCSQAATGIIGEQWLFPQG